MDGLPNDQRVWNTAAMIGFIALFIVGFFVGVRWWGEDVFFTLGWIDIILIALATHRLTRLVTNDKIFAFVREWFMDPGQDENTWVKPAGGVRRLMAELIECVWCTSMWAALVALSFYLIGAVGKFAIMMLAVSSLGMILYHLSGALSRISARSEDALPRSSNDR